MNRKCQYVCDDTLETTLAIIKPHAIQYSREILQTFMKNGFRILQRKKFQLSPEQAADFYVEFEKFKCFVLLVLNLSNGPIEAVILTKENAIDDFLTVLGPVRPSEARFLEPNSLRALFGDCSDDFKNAVHGSTDPCKAQKEIHFFYPNFIIKPTLRDEPKKLCTQRYLMDHLMEGLLKVVKKKPSDPVTFLANFLLEHNPNCPVICDSKNKSDICLEEYVEPIKLDPICDEKLPEKEEEIPVANDDCTCSCNVVISPNNPLFCPICNKIIQYAIEEQCPADCNEETIEENTTSSRSKKSNESNSCDGQHCKCDMT